MRKLILILLLAGTGWSQCTTGGSGTCEVGSGKTYATIQACANAAMAGQTCTIYSGTYTETVTPPSDGTAGNYITFSGQTGAVMNGDWVLTARQYLIIQGLTVNGRFYTATNTLTFAQFVQIRNNTINTTCSLCNDIALHANDILVEGNTFTGTDQDFIHPYGARWVIRNNYAHDQVANPAVHMDFVQSYCNPNDATGTAVQYSLIEGNKYVNMTGSGNEHFFLVNDTDACPANPPINNIIRFNEINYLGSGAISVDANAQAPGAGNNVIYNNTFRLLGLGNFTADYQNCCNMGASNSSGGINNVEYDSMGPTNQTGFYIGSVTGWFQSNNLYFDPSATITFAGAAVSETGAIKNQDPLFVSSSDLHLQAGSPAIGAGGPLTTVSSGCGTTSLVVGNSDFFQPGWAGQSADWVRVGASTTAQITAIDYATNTLTFGGSVTCTNGDNVYLYKTTNGTVVLNGASPDIGAYPYGTAPPSYTRQRSGNGVWSGKAN